MSKEDMLRTGSSSRQPFLQRPFHMAADEYIRHKGLSTGSDYNGDQNVTVIEKGKVT
jgi:hypothetical protein